MPNNGVASVVSFLLNQQIITVEPAGLCFFFVRSFARLLVSEYCLFCSVFHLTCNNIPFESLFLLTGVCIRTTTARVTMMLALATEANREHTIYYFCRCRIFIGALFLISFSPRRINAQSWLRSIPFQFNKHTHHTLELFRSYRTLLCMSARSLASKRINKQTNTSARAHTRSYKNPQQRRKTENQVNARDNKKNFNFGRRTTVPP